MKMRNMKNGNGNGVANQFIIEDGDTKVFQSYDSKIAEYATDAMGRHLTVYPEWDSSSTTLKYFKDFINNETIFNYETKAKFIKLAHEDARIVLKR